MVAHRLIAGGGIFSGLARAFGVNMFQNRSGGFIDTFMTVPD